jgi:hypothetical protein
VGRYLKLIIAGVLLGLLPFVIFVGGETVSTENGEIVEYSYLNLAAVIGGIAAAGVGIALLRRDSERGERPPGRVMAVGALVVLLGLFQIVRGFGFFPGITGCVSDTGSAGFCATTNTGAQAP